MNIDNAEMKKVSDSFERLEFNTKKVIKWVKDNSSSPCVKKSEASVNRALTEVLVNARRLKNISLKPCSIGLFGQSQAGKSYLVSCLAGDERSDLKAKFGHDTYNFIKDINPSGGGKESTGLVTRFTILDKDDGVFEYPVKVELLREVEIAMILINSFYEDSYESPDLPSKESFDKLLTRLENLSRTGKRNNNIQDDVILFKNYLNNNKKKLYKTVPKTLWDMALDILTELDLEDRANFYSFFWNGNEAFTKCFKILAQYIAKINSDVIYLQLNSLLVQESPKGLSIVNVDALKKIDINDEELKYSTKDGYIGLIPRSILAAIIAELYIHVKDPQYKDDILSKMDLLDFPGYRGRLNENIEEFDVNDAFEISGQSGRSKIAECFLRGKVAYLFEKYIDNHDLNCLVVCADSNNQIESGIDNVINRWLENTQGETADKRKEHQSGLFWVLTKFDMRLSADLDKKPEYGKNGLLQQTFLERFGKYEWVGNWNGTEDNPKPFKNIFLVRKLNQSSCSFIQIENNKESCHLKDKKATIDQLKYIFIKDPEIKKYFEYPERAWDEVVALNNGGIKFLCDKIRTTDALKIRYSKFIEILRENAVHARRHIEDWYQDENKEALWSKKEKQLKALVSKKVLVHFGEILDLFNLPENIIKDCYYFDQNANFYIEHNQNIQEEPSEETTVVASIDTEVNTSNDDLDEDLDFDFNDLFDEALEKEKFIVNSSASNNSVVSNKVGSLKLETSARIYNNWYDYLTNLNSNINDISDSTIHFLASEIKAYAERTNLAQVLDQKLKYISDDMGKKDQFYPSVQSVVSIVLSDFISTLNNTVKLEEIEELSENQFPQLSAEELNPDKEKQKKVVPWLNQIKTIAKENSAHAPNGITKDENKKLGDFIDEYSNLEDAGNE